MDNVRKRKSVRYNMKQVLRDKRDEELRGGKPLMDYPFGVVLLVYSAFGEQQDFVKAFITATGRTITLLAEELGISRTHLSLMLNGKRKFSDWVSFLVAEDIRITEHDKNALVSLARDKVGHDVAISTLEQTALDYAKSIF